MVKFEDCELCGERMVGTLQGSAEMYDPENPDEDSVICHPECGLAEGLEVA